METDEEVMVWVTTCTEFFRSKEIEVFSSEAEFNPELT